MSTLTLGHSPAAQSALRQLGKSSLALSRVHERLASGARINHASDDAAGLTVSESLRKDARLYSQAIRNVNDGISALTIADEALAQQSAILTRLTELAEQAANGTYSFEQRGSLNNEYQALVQEFNRIAASTQFNGQKLLLSQRGEGIGSLALQSGVDGSASSVLTAELADSGSLSGVVTIGKVTKGLPSENSLVTVPDYTVFAQIVAEGERALYENYRAILHTSMMDSQGLNRDLLFVLTDADPAGNKLGYQVASIDPTTGELQYGLYMNGVIYGELDYDPVTGKAAGGSAAYEITIDDFRNSNHEGIGVSGTLTMDFSTIRFVNETATGTKGTAIDYTGVESAFRARDALTVATNRLDDINAQRGQIGALISRLNTASSTLSQSRTQAVEAESRIRDADYATESASLIREQILQQVATAVLANANQDRASALDLL